MITSLFNLGEMKKFRIQQVSDGSGSKNLDSGRVNFLSLGLRRVSLVWLRFWFGKFSLQTSIFSFLDQKNIFGLGQ